MGAQKGLKRATLKCTKTQLPKVLEARKKNNFMKIKAKQALQTKANLQAKGAGPGCHPPLAACRPLRGTAARRTCAQPPGCGRLALPRRVNATRAHTPGGVRCVCVLLRRVACAAPRELTRAACAPCCAQLWTPPPLRRPRSGARRT